MVCDICIAKAGQTLGYSITLLCWSCSAYNKMCSTHKHLVVVAVVVIVPFISDRNGVTMYKSSWLIHFFHSSILSVFLWFVFFFQSHSCAQKIKLELSTFGTKKMKSRIYAQKRPNFSEEQKNSKKWNCFIAKKVNKNMNTPHVSHIRPNRFKCHRWQQQVSDVRFFWNSQRMLLYLLWGPEYLRILYCIFSSSNLLKW